jgi:hypothetical protein
MANQRSIAFVDKLASIEFDSAVFIRRWPLHMMFNDIIEEVTGTMRQRIQHDDIDKLSGISSRWTRKGNLVRKFDAELIRKSILDDGIPLADMVRFFGEYQSWGSRLRAARAATSLGWELWWGHLTLTVRLMKRRLFLHWRLGWTFFFPWGSGGGAGTCAGRAQ